MLFLFKKNLGFRLRVEALQSTQLYLLCSLCTTSTIILADYQTCNALVWVKSHTICPILSLFFLLFIHLQYFRYIHYSNYLWSKLINKQIRMLTTPHCRYTACCFMIWMQLAENNNKTNDSIFGHDNAIALTNGPYSTRTYSFLSIKQNKLLYM